MAIYFTDKHEQLCRDWLTASERQKSLIYKKLSPAINTVIKGVSYTYYAVPLNKKYDLHQDCLSHIFTNLHKFNPDKSAYSYISASVKYYYYDRLVRYKNINNIDYIDEYQDNPPIIYEQKEWDFVYIINHFNSKIKTYEEHMPKAKGRTKEGYNNIIRLYRLCIEFIEKYGSFNDTDVYDYLINNSTLTQTNLSHYMYRMFGTYIVRKEKEIHIDDKYHYMVDDWTPNHKKVGNKRFMLKKYNTW